MRVPRPIYWAIRKLVPIACVDALPYRIDEAGVAFAGLILRDGKHPDMCGRALVGGAILRRETIADALLRHLNSTLVGEDLQWKLPDPEAPVHAAEYFPNRKPGERHDPRKHAVALSYLVELEHGQIRGWQGDEAVGFDWFRLDSLPSSAEFAFGQGSVIDALVERLRTSLGERAVAYPATRP